MENLTPEAAPLASLGQWEDDVLQRYPEPGEPAKMKEEFRNYDDSLHWRECARPACAAAH
jgi:hypothetical protein